jgi:hypothetical protein
MASVTEISEMFKAYSVATVSTNVNGNFIANSLHHSAHETIEKAISAAKKLDAEMEEKFRERDDFGNGAIRGEEVIIHDGYDCF